LFFPSWVVFLVAGVPRLTAGPPDGSRPALQCARLPPQGSCFQSLLCPFPVAVCLFPCVVVVVVVVFVVRRVLVVVVVVVVFVGVVV